MHPARGMATMALCLLGNLGCDRIASEQVPNTEETDRIWADSNMVCARRPHGLICWKAEPGNLTAHPPTIFDGIGTVSSLGLRESDGCALSDLGMGCFRLSDKQLARGGRGVPKELVSFGKAKRMFCARGDDGVDCFADKIEELKPFAVFERPRMLHATLRGSGVCGEYDGELRCFTSDSKGGLLATARIRGVRGVRSVRIEEEPAWVLVLDEEGLKLANAGRGAFGGRELTGVTEKDFPAAATVKLEPVTSVVSPVKLTAEGTWAYVLDGEGVKSVAMGDKGLELQLWPMEQKATDLWQGREGAFFVASEGQLRMHARKGEERINRVVRGIRNPRDVAAGDHFTCIVHDEGVSCVKNKPD